MSNDFIKEVVGTNASASLREVIKINKPNISNNSLKTYNSLLISFAKKMNEEPSIDFYNNNTRILEFIKDKITNINSRKSLLTALYVVTLNQIYKDNFLLDIETVRKNDLENLLNEKQIKNHISYENIIKKHSELQYGSKEHTILSCMCGVYIPPRRLLDWSEMKFKNYDELKDNFIDFEKSSLVFNIYKTAGKYNKQTFVIPKALVDIIQNYSKNSKNNYLFNDAKGNKCETYTLNSYINKIFNNNVGINGMRKTFVSEKVLPFLPKLKELEYYARFMGHSIGTQLTYKKDFN